VIKKKPGFTLLEIMIALGITVIILGIASSMFITGNKVFSDSDVKTTLQIERQTIQEKISDIGMQATGIKLVSGDTNSCELNSMKISSYNKDGSSHNYIFKIDDSGNKYKDGSKIYEFKIDDQVISGNVKSFKIDSNSIKSDADGKPLVNVNSIGFTILLRKEKGYSNVEQTINFRVAFRNK